MAKTKTTLENKHHWKSFMDKDYIGGFNLTDMDAIVTITRYERENVKSVQNPDGEVHFVLYVKDSKAEHKFIVNMTNGNNIQNALGSADPETWIGKQVQLHTAKVRAFGKEHDALRVRNVAPVAEKVDTKKAEASLKKAKTLDELKTAFMALSKKEQTATEKLKDELKANLT